MADDDKNKPDRDTPEWRSLYERELAKHRPDTPEWHTYRQAIAAEQADAWYRLSQSLKAFQQETIRKARRGEPPGGLLWQDIKGNWLRWQDIVRDGELRWLILKDSEAGQNATARELVRWFRWMEISCPGEKQMSVFIHKLYGDLGGKPGRKGRRSRR